MQFWGRRWELVIAFGEVEFAHSIGLKWDKVDPISRKLLLACVRPLPDD